MSLAFIVMSLNVQAKDSEAYNPSIKMGEGTVRITVDGSSAASADSLTFELYYLPFFSQDFQVIPATWTQTENERECTIPMELTDMLVCLRISNGKEPLAVSDLQVSQRMPTEIRAKFDGSRLEITSVTPSSDINDLWTQGLTGALRNPTAIDGEVLGKFVYFPYAFINKIIPLDCDDFKDWRVMTEKYDSAYVIQLRESIGDRPLPAVTEPWFSKNLNNLFIAAQRMRYHTLAETYGCKVESYPAGYYSFMKTVDFGDDFLKYFPFGYTPYYLLCQMLSNFDSIPPVGDLRGDEWRETARTVLAEMDVKADSRLLDLLLASSYMMQLRENKPLNVVQSERVAEAFTNDLGKIVLAANERLKHDMNAKVDINDFTADANFSLIKFIDEKFPGQPVIVDMWNTWCGPCMISHKKIGELKAAGKLNGVAMLYLSDSSSNASQWERVAHSVGGTHAKLSKVAMDKVMDSYKFNSIPAYLFFNADHILQHKMMSYPGNEEFERLANDIRK